jgi:hypothetical protein
LTGPRHWDRLEFVFNAQFLEDEVSYRVAELALQPTPIVSLRPTQMTLGMHEVLLKRKSWAAHDPKKLNAFLSAHMVPVILGPGKLHYLIDHHHLARALYEQGVTSVFVTIVADMSGVDPDLFWNVMEFRGWIHPYDSKGRRREPSALPRNVRGMKDDPYRSLAGELRNIGGFAKEATPFAEFLWADFLRARIKIKAIQKDFDASLAKARDLARSPEANYLPGWCAPRAPATKKGAEKKSKAAGKREQEAPVSAQ